MKKGEIVMIMRNGLPRLGIFKGIMKTNDKYCTVSVGGVSEIYHISDVHKREHIEHFDGNFYRTATL